MGAKRRENKLVTERWTARDPVYQERKAKEKERQEVRRAERASRAESGKGA